MAHFIQMSAAKPLGVWLIEGSEARRIDVTNSAVCLPAGEDALCELRRRYSGTIFYRSKLAPGQYYPRMARPNNFHPGQSPGTNPANASQRTLIETGRGQLTALRSQLEGIFRVLHPVETNFGAYGHEIRNLLILAATEVETHWKGVLSANGSRGESTHDYVKLSEAMKLDEFAIRLPFYPWLAPVKPFEGWRPSPKPTQDLPWYAAYNGVKHNREAEFSRATLLNALKAVCGCAVMTFAQFGTSGFHYRQEINSFFELDEAPAWEPSDVYIAPFEVASHMAINYPF